MIKHVLLIISTLLVCTFCYNNPNTAISGTSDNYIRFTDNTAVTLSNPEIYDKELGEDFTIELWFRKTVGKGEYRPLVAKHLMKLGTRMGIDNGRCEFLVEVQYNDALNFFSGCGSFVNYGYYVAVNQPYFYPALKKYTVIRDRWTHVAVTIEWKEEKTGVGTGIAKIYADGILVDAALWGASSPKCNGRKRIRNPGVPITLGYFDNQEGILQYWIGDMDELRIWKVARTESQIHNYFHGGIPIYYEGLVSYHTFSEGILSDNEVPLYNGLPRINFYEPNNLILKNSDLKLWPNVVVSAKGLTITAQPIGPESVDLFLVKFVMNTDAMFLWSDSRDPRQRNIRRQITSADLPLNIGQYGNVNGINNVIEYVPGNIAGIDLIYYEARNNASFPEPSGPSVLVFETVCTKGVEADSCRVCGGNNTHCKHSCDKKGGVKDICGVCNGDGSSCIGCDQVAFSNRRIDYCGICGGDNSCLGSCNGTYDECQVCNGNNSCCTNYHGVPIDRVDYFLVEQTLNELISQLKSARDFVTSMDRLVYRNNLLFRKNDYYSPTYVDIPSSVPRAISNRIQSMNNLCSVTDSFISELDTFLTSYGEEIRKPWPPLHFPFSLE